MTLAAAPVTDAAASAPPRRSSRRVALAAPAVAILFAAMGWYWWSVLSLGEPVSLEVIERTGTVRVDGSTGEPVRRDNATGASLETGADGFATVRLGDGSTLELAPGTRVRIGEARRDADSTRFRTVIELDVGEITNRVVTGDDRRRSVSLVTDSVNIGVRGTVYSVRHEPGLSRLMVSEGRIEAQGATGPGAEVGRDFGTLIRRGSAPLPPVRLPPPPRPVAPVAGAGSGLGPLRFSWETEGVAATWEIELASDRHFARRLALGRSESDSASLPPLPADGEYWWRVATIDANGLRGGWSEPQRFVQDHYFLEGRRALESLDPARARAMFGNARSEIDPELDRLRDQAVELLVSGDSAGARDRLGVVLEVRPSDVPARNALGMALVGLGEWPGARSAFDHALRLSPDDPEAHLGLAYLAFRQADFAAAFVHAGRCLEADPRNVQALELRAISAVNTGDVGAARAALAALTAVDPRNATAHALAGNLDALPDPRNGPASPGAAPRDPGTSPGG